ncbi:MAG: hypothetical protein SF097_11400 [Acidobacteriota bacterium]|nr:hypothetical protein [Acidobacteriota bacterium]
MKLKDARENYYYYSQKTSEITRQLGLAGIALIWVFKVDSGGRQSVPLELVRPAWLIVLGLTLDFLQYSLASVVWGIYHRHKEKVGIGEDAEFLAPTSINWPTILFFWSKIIVMGIAYVYLLRFLANKIL